MPVTRITTYQITDGTLVNTDYSLTGQIDPLKIAGAGVTSNAWGYLSGVTSQVIGISDSNILTNKTITGQSDVTAAKYLFNSAGNLVVVNGSTPTSGQALTATSATAATWQSIGNGVASFGTSNFIWNEIPSGVKNGSNSVFALSSTASGTGYMALHRNGLRLRVGTGDQDYSVLGLTGISMSSSQIPISTDNLIVDYITDPLAASPASEAGWTTFSTSVDSRIIYVSNTEGSDSNNGTGAFGTAPKATVAAGLALMRDGFPDWCLFKRGDIWNETIGTWAISGRSDSERMVFGAYGGSGAVSSLTGERPIFRVNGVNGFANAFHTHGGNLAILDIYFLQTGNGIRTDTNGLAGIQCSWPMQNFTMEGCRVEGWTTNVTLNAHSDDVAFDRTPVHKNFAIRRNVICDAWSATGTQPNCQGLYTAAISGLLVEENILDRNGWHTGQSGSHDTGLRRNMYIGQDYHTGQFDPLVVWEQMTDGVQVVNNFGLRTDGFQVRAGGLISGNIISRCKGGMGVGNAGANDALSITGVPLNMRRNIVIEQRLENFDEAPAAFYFCNLRDPNGSYVIDNIAANSLVNINTHDHRPIWFRSVVGNSGVTGASINWPVTWSPLTVSGNLVYKCGMGVDVEGVTGQYTPGYVTWSNNEVVTTGSTIFSTAGILVAGNESVVDSWTGSGNKYYQSGVATGSWFELSSTLRSPGYFSNLIGDTTYTTGQTSFLDPTRNLAAYNVTIGGNANHDEFCDELRNQRKGNWRTAYTAPVVAAWLRAGFNR